MRHLFILLAALVLAVLAIFALYVSFAAPDFPVRLMAGLLGVGLGVQMLSLAWLWDNWTN